MTVSYTHLQPVQGIEKNTVKLGEEALENVKMGTNEITGDISVSAVSYTHLDVYKRKLQTILRTGTHRCNSGICKTDHSS